MASISVSEVGFYVAWADDFDALRLEWLRLARPAHTASEPRLFLQKCPLCQRACPGGHFHAIEAPGEPHLCGREHACADPATGAASLCACAGSCDISARLQKERKENAVVRVYEGKRDKFTYEYKTRQDVKRNVCTQKVPPGQLRHAGPCCCEIKAEDHFCAHECPGCLYRCGFATRAFCRSCMHGTARRFFDALLSATMRAAGRLSVITDVALVCCNDQAASHLHGSRRCTKPHQHGGRHAMQHGNMESGKFLANRDFELGDRKCAHRSDEHDRFELNSS